MTTSLQWNPLDPASIRDPYPIYAELRDQEPVHWHPAMRSWVLTRYDDCQRVLRDHAVFARDRRRAGGQVPEDKVNIQTQDPPDQALLRGITGKALSAQPLEQICVDAAATMRERIRALAGTGPFDLMRDVAGPAAIEVINRLFGVDEFTQTTYLPIYRGLTQLMDSGLDPGRITAGREAGAALRAAVGGWIERRDGESGLLGLLYANSDVAEMSPQYVLNTVIAIYNAGFSTTYASAGSITLELLRPDVLEMVGRLDGTDRGALLLAADEMLRYTSPAQATARTAITDADFDGVLVKGGDVLVTMLAAANRDPAQFDNPDDIVLDRSPNQHLAFAWGPHICLGARLAQAWVIELIKFAQEFGPYLRPAGDIEYMSAATLRNIVSLPVEYTGPRN